MPIYNRAAYLREAVNSVLQQSMRDFELLVMDDGSTDDTPVILKRYAEEDRRVRIFSREHQGQIACRNELLQLANADVIACADADDICLPGRFERQLAIMAGDGDLWILGTAAVSINRKGARRRSWRVPTGSVAVGSELERGCCMVHSSCMMRTKNIVGIGGYRRAYECAEDYDLFLRASQHGKVDNLDMVGVLYRQHEGNVSHRCNLRQAISTDLARATYFLRTAGHPDPTDGLSEPPGLDDPMLTALIQPMQMELHRAMAIAMAADASASEIEYATALLLQARIGRKRARAAQRAMIRLMRRRRFDALTLRLAVGAFALGPIRMIRRLLEQP